MAFTAVHSGEKRIREMYTHTETETQHDASGTMMATHTSSLVLLWVQFRFVPHLATRLPLTTAVTVARPDPRLFRGV